MFQRLSKYFLDGDDSHAIFALANCAKDLRYYTHMAEATPVVGFIAEAVHQTFQMANTRGSKKQTGANDSTASGTVSSVCRLITYCVYA
jgi:3-hydroxyisobutyrate dehydrogenase-like beta-hydroxyacid dehydrogenase